ncbi:hypothetical protein [Listeria seeligeri]|uniref:hypothetical protein n=1 Tax=Listeria seeligeri TaxID=1640 RepID=UPI0022EAE88D|nr:hypothetical protein [Listeria seeligeri]
MKVILINGERCQFDLHEEWDITNVEQVKEKLSELQELTEGELVDLSYVRVWSGYYPFGLFKFVGIEDGCMLYQYLYVKWV